jgi:hypothetical protein
MSRLIAIAAATLAISTSAVMAAESNVNLDPTGHRLPMHAIANGHNIQPRSDNLKALGYSDLTLQAAEEVDHLYRQLMR